LDNRFVISSAGLGSTGSYVFADLVKSLPVTRRSNVRDVAQMLSNKCWPILFKVWPTIYPALPSTLLNDHSLPVVMYFIGGNEFPSPEVYAVRVFIDWNTHRLKRPTVTKEYPNSPELTKQLMAKGPMYAANIVVIHQGLKGGGMDQLLTDGSMFQRRYLRLYPKEIGAYVRNETLDADSLTSLGRIMLAGEIEADPRDFGFPVVVCSIPSGKGAKCQPFDH
jgi:hypothetical protein